MITKEKILDYYWNYYVKLEEDFLKISKYVEICKTNYNTYSMEYLKLYQAICSEVDVIAKEICVNCGVPIKKTEGIGNWGYYIEKDYPDIISFKVNCQDLVINPYPNWKHEEYVDNEGKLRKRLVGNSRNPKWWTEYNKVKHKRIVLSEEKKGFNYKKANLKNVLFSLAGLFAFELILFEIFDIDKEQYSSQIFKVL